MEILLTQLNGLDELEGYHANRTTNYMFRTTLEIGDEVVYVKQVLSPHPLFHY